MTVEWLTVAEPGETDQVPYSHTCNAGGCDEDTAMIIKSVRKVNYVGEVQELQTFWVSVCRKHSKAHMDYAFDMLGSVSAVIVHPDQIDTELTEDL